MSYARWGEDGSHVFVINNGDRYICVGCNLASDTVSFDAVTPYAAEMLAHLEKHRAAGHIVPERAFERLREE